MKLIECNTTVKLRKYVGKSTSWRVALKASGRKWEKKIELPGDLCGFCFVAKNIVANIAANKTAKSDCAICPVEKLCDSRRKGLRVFVLEEQKMILDAFNSPALKTLIDNSKPGQIFTSKEKL